MVQLHATSWGGLTREKRHMNASATLPQLRYASPRSAPNASTTTYRSISLEHTAHGTMKASETVPTRFSISSASRTHLNAASVESVGSTQIKQQKVHQSVVLRRLSSSISLQVRFLSRLESDRIAIIIIQRSTNLTLWWCWQEIEINREKKAASSWVAKYHEEAKRDLVDIDIVPLMDRFENITLYQKPHRKPLNVALEEMNTTRMHPSPNSSSANAEACGANPQSDKHQSTQVKTLQQRNTLKRQAPHLIVKRRTDIKNHKSAAGSESKSLASPNSRAARIIPSRFLYDMSRWKQSARCDYCNFAGGDLECATCDVIAHARCYLAAYESTVKKTKGAFVVPTRFSWLCFHCQQSLQEEYDERSKNARMQHIAMQRSIFGKVVTAYVRMTKDAMIFQAKKKAIIKIQSAIRGRLARWRFDRLQRMCLKPYAIDSIKARGFNSEGIEITAVSEDLRLSNGFTCNPFVYVSVVDGKDDENQLFCFETTLRKGVSLLDTEIAWNDKLFVPGVDGNITFCFTLLSKNGPNNFFLGQAILRLRDSDVIWRNGITTELALIDEVEIFPKNTQHQLLRLVEVGGSQVNTDRGSQKKKNTCNETTNGLFANGSSFALTLSVHVKPFSEVHSYCGYMGMKNTLDSFQTSSRWCVLADGILRIYRHFGVTLASDTVDMARTIDIKLVEAHKITNNGVLHRDQNCIAIQHMNRLYLLHCDQQSQNRVWLKKLIAATKFGTITASAPSPQQLQTIASTIGILSNNNTSESNGG